MCELFAMSSRFPAAVDICLDELARHGGQTGPHRDGWGISYYAEDGAVQLYKEAEPASGSDWVQFIQEHHLRSTIVLSHIRRATQGGRSLKNTQPFRRELGGKCHVFAHNGDLVDIKAHPDFKLGFHRPIGETDSEYAFCALLGQLEKPWLSTSGVPPLKQRLAIIVRFARGLRRPGHGQFHLLRRRLRFRSWEQEAAQCRRGAAPTGPSRTSPRLGDELGWLMHRRSSDLLWFRMARDGSGRQCSVDC